MMAAHTGSDSPKYGASRREAASSTPRETAPPRKAVR
jgi:hypothetical protein